MKNVLIILAMFFSFAAKAQKVDSIYFHLYTDSLKKGTYNYINVDGEMRNGKFLPMMSDEITFSSSAGRWEGNSLVIDSTFAADSVVISAVLTKHPDVKKTVTIYIKKLSDPPLKTEKELMDQWRKKPR